jgi:hypothetical protein
MDLYINDNGEFWDGKPIELNGLKYISPNAELLAQVGYHLYVPPQPTEQELLEQAKFDKENEIDAYDASLERFTINGITMWLGHELRQQLKTSVEAYIATGAENVTKWFVGQEFTFPCNVWLQMLAVLEVYAAEVLNTTERQKAAVNALESVSEVEDYDITQGYPAEVVFTPQRLAEMGK